MKKRYSLRIRPRIVAIALIHMAMLLSLMGCKSIADYQANSLPAEFRAAAPESDVVDLTRVAHQSINANQIYVGDTLDVSVSTGIEENGPQVWSLRVDNGGEVSVPVVGLVRVAGLAPNEAEVAIRQASLQREIYRDPYVSVLVKQRQTISVRVAGEVEKPGIYELPAAGSDVLAALVAAGGMSEDAGSVLEIRHPNRSIQNGVALASYQTNSESIERVMQVDLRESATKQSRDFRVEYGSVIMVMPKPKHSISVIGLVRKPDSYEYPPDETLRVLDAIAMAGGLNLNVANKIHVIRDIPDRNDPVVIEISFKRAKSDGDENLVLQPGDTVVVEETPTTVVVGGIRSFIRFGFSSGIPGL